MFIRCSSGMLLMQSLLVMASVKSTKSFDDVVPPLTLTYSVVEEQPAGTELGDLLTDTGLVSAVNRSDIGQIHFSMLPGKHK